MAKNINRRTWLKSGALLTAGLASAPGLLQAVPHARKSRNTALPFAEEARLLQDMPKLKARLLANENPFGPSEKAKQALVASLDNVFEYGFGDKRQLAMLIAEKENVSVDSVLLGPGSTELLTAASFCFALADPAKNKIICADPAYDSLMETAEDHGAERVAVPLDKLQRHDLGAMSAKVGKNTALVYLCNPSNPNGTMVDAADLQGFVKNTADKVPVFIDEAYIDYAQNPATQTAVPLIAQGHNVLVARTFSKVHAFAGLRVGYLLGQPDTIKAVQKFSSAGAMSMSTPSVAAAIASYQDAGFVNFSIEKNNEAKAFTYALLKELDYEYIPSHTNFVLFPLRMHGRDFRTKMMQKGVGIRVWEFNKQHWCRVSMGKMEHMALFAEAFREIVS